MASKIKYETVTGHVWGVISDALNELNDLGSDCQESADALEEKFSSTERYQLLSDAADTLNSLSEVGEPDGPVGDLPVQYQVGHKRRMSKALRLQNALTALQAADEVVQEFLDKFTEPDEDGEDYEDAKRVKEELETVIGEVENVSL